ncbi:MAG: DHH family phosphoesterase [candidate division KSB1 bacterium]|nr:DHH family phosphoesterase [candidate division KSB1 bacterium]
MGQELKREALEQLDALFAGQQTLLVVTHSNPDPDALASGMALSYVAERRYGVHATFAYEGFVWRAENRALVRELQLHLKKASTVWGREFDRVALVDAQPGAGNVNLPQSLATHLVIDHHARGRGLQAEVAFVDSEVGATATLLVELVQAAGLPFPSDLATGLTYAIRSETQDLGRETSLRDVRAYYAVLPLSSARKLARIVHPKLPRSYFAILARTLARARTFRHLIVANIGEVPGPDAVAEMADMLLRCSRVSWSLCTGRFGGNLVVSVRASSPRAQADRLVKSLVLDRRNAGGHGTFAGGVIPLGSNPDKAEEIEERLCREFARRLGHDVSEWRPLVPGDGA